MLAATALDSFEDAVRRRGLELVELYHATLAEPQLAFAERGRVLAVRQRRHSRAET
jgi:hypothetical protein